jgi:hypothetical protein
MNKFLMELKAQPDQIAEPSDDDIRKINSLNKNGPIRKLTKEEVHVRSLIILGEEPTTKLSIHPESEIGGKKINTLSSLSKMLPGAPMLEGHRKDKVPWARIFDAEVTDKAKGYKGKVLRIKHFFLRGPEGDSYAQKIDAGIWGEYSISYQFSQAVCSICHNPIGILSFLLTGKKPCRHTLGKKDPETGRVAYWYPEKIVSVLEVSNVFRGAYQKTKNVTYSDAEVLEHFSAGEREQIVSLDRVLESHHSINGDTDEQQSEENQGGSGSDEGGSGGGGTGDGNPPVKPEPSSSGDLNITPDYFEKAKELASDPNLDQSELEDALKSISGGDTAILSVLKSYVSTIEKKAPAAPSALPENTIPYFACSCGHTAALKVDKCVCPKCGHEVEHEAGKPCKEYLCPKCKVKMDPKTDNAMECPECKSDMVVSHEVSRSMLCSDCGEVSEASAGYGDITGICPSCSGITNLVITNLASIFKPVGPIKPLKAGTVNNEYFELESFKDLPAGDYFIDPKYDGVYFEMHKKGDLVRLFTDQGNEHTEKFPSIVSEAKGIKSDNFIVVGEVVKYKGNKRLSHSDVSAYIHSKRDKWDDSAFRFKPFDQVLSGGKSLEKMAFRERRKVLDKDIPWGKRIHPTSGRWVSHEPAKGKIITVIEDRKTREGAMVKNAVFTYNKAGRKQIYKWKQQHEVDALVKSIQERNGGGFVYTCLVGRGKNRQLIGETYTTKIKAAVDDIITVSVDKVTYDEAEKRYSWTAPKVTMRREDKKEPDPLSTLRRIAQVRNSKNADNVILLGDIVPVLKKHNFGQVLYLTGSIVEHGLTVHDVDIVHREVLSDEVLQDIKKAVGSRIAQYLDFTLDSNGPAGPSIELKPDMSAEELAAWKHADKFVLQRHGWGRKEHFDLRFGAPKTPRMWGWTIFSKPPVDAGIKKVRCQEKKYHDPKWMDVDKETIRPGQPGHPGQETFKGNAHMVKVDSGKYQYVTRKPKFLEVILHGDKYKGRYVFREIEVKDTKNASSSLAIKGDETGVKSEKIWIMWKPKDQEPSKPIKKMAFQWRNGVLTFWETDEIDHEVESSAPLPIETKDLSFE